ncbi:hypothetical protein LCGC14_1719780 [marine sediment metagenome]|uniref:Uncharacterized protein n=1 Tax=marine sediment metagenome TaxID=412755 RepID=A0A0F9JT81_9ZZZZ
MAPVTLPPIQAVPGSVDGSTPQAMATADNYIMRNDGKTILHFIKAGANPATITIVTPKTVGGLAVAEQTFVVAASGGVEFAGPFPPDLYNDASGDIDISTSEATDITVQAIRV